VTDDTDVISARTVNGVSVAIAILALFLSIFALGRAMSDTGDSAPGGDAAAGGDAASAPVAVALSEFAITPSTINVRVGGSLTVTNDGATEHNLRVRTPDIGTSNLLAGTSESLDLSSLTEGSYEVFCSIPGHEAAGMVGDLVVGGASAPAGGGGEELTGMARAEWLRANYEASVSQFPAQTAALGNQPMAPEILPDGTKLFELTLDETQWEIAPGEFVLATAYNGMVPGPWIDLEVGDTVTIRVINELDDEATTLHPHGVFMHPFEVDGVGMVSMEPIMPGEQWEGTFTTKEPSVAMYHGHDNGVRQVIDGGFGVITIGDMPLPPEADNVVSENVMVLNDAGSIGLTLNAKSFPATEPYVLNDGEQMVMHYYNEGLTAHPMHLHNNAQLVIAKDGYPLDVPYYADTINIAPGERYTVVVFAESPGVWVWHCHILTHVEKNDGSVFGMFTALIVNESVAEADNTDRDAGRDGDGAAETPPVEGESPDEPST